LSIKPSCNNPYRFTIHRETMAKTSMNRTRMRLKPINIIL
jgi:hypothetical protein